MPGNEHPATIATRAHASKERMPKSYDSRKSYRGRSYTGMKVGRTHTWDYKGEWKERKLAPDLWEVSFRATKKRRGKAPAGSGAAVGTEYHWFFAPIAQSARKLDANRYQTHLEGLKWKIGFRPATSETWDHQWAKTGETARQRAIRVLEHALADLKADERLDVAALEAPDLVGARKVPAKTRARQAAKRRVLPGERAAEAHA